MDLYFNKNIGLQYYWRGITIPGVDEGCTLYSEEMFEFLDDLIYGREVKENISSDFKEAILDKIEEIVEIDKYENPCFYDEDSHQCWSFKNLRGL